MTRPTAPALRYHGAKWKLAPWILGHFPPHECYVEPTLRSAEAGGSAALLLNKGHAWLEVYNDLCGDLVTFFRMLRDRPDELIRSIRFTPFAEEEWRLALEPAAESLEIARRFYVRAYLNFSGATATANGSWRRQKVVTQENGRRRMTPACLAFKRITHLYQVAERLGGVQIEHTTAARAIATYDSPTTLFYIDPPYPAATRQRWKTNAYAFELTDSEHADLATQLHGIQGMAIISGYGCPLYRRLYPDWPRFERHARRNGLGSTIESLWLSPATAARAPQLALPVSDNVTVLCDA